MLIIIVPCVHNWDEDVLNSWKITSLWSLMVFNVFDVKMECSYLMWNGKGYMGLHGNSNLMYMSQCDVNLMGQVYPS